MPKSSGNQPQPTEVQNLVALLKVGKHKEVQAKSRKLIKKFPDAPVLYDILSNAQLSQSDFKGAAKTLEALLKMQPSYVDGEYNLGMAYMNLGQTGDAVARFQSVADRKPDNPDVFNNLGASLFEMEQFEEAIAAYEKALKLKPDFVPALRNLGAALRDMRRYEESEKYLSKIPFLMPRYAPGHLSLGVTYKNLGKDEKARKCFETTLKLDPENREAHYELGNIHAQEARYMEAGASYAKVDTAEARVKVYEMMHQAGENPKDLVSGLSKLNRNEPSNLRAAAFSAFVSQQYEVSETHSFAPDPLDFVFVNNILDYLEEDPDYLLQLMREAERVTAVWENRTTRMGFQTHGNLFEQAEIFAGLEDLIRSKLEEYRDVFANKEADIIRKFPKKYDLNGWHVKLVKSGYQKPHIHTRGWVSGVLYLKIPKEVKGNEGSIAFSLHGYDYRKEKNEVPVKEHMPKAGELVLFPSSLFHHTIPFSSDEDRQCIAFDVLPA